MINSGSMNPEWFVGMVEQVEGRNGRVKVRCFGYHPEDQQAVSTDDLPWGYIINNNFNKMFNWPEEGQLVFGFFMDGRDAQRPMIMGSISGEYNTSLPRNAAGDVPLANSDENYEGLSNQEGAVDTCELYSQLRDSGLSHNHAIGMMSNIQSESGFRPGLHEVGGGGGIGLFQYTNSARKNPFLSAVPDWETNWVGQVRYAANSDPETIRYRNQNFGSSFEAANWFTRNWERPAAIHANSRTAPGGANAVQTANLERAVANCQASTPVG